MPPCFRVSTWMCVAALLLAANAPASGAEAGAPPMLLGSCPRDSLLSKPYEEWYTRAHDAYEPHPDVLAQLQRAPHDVDLTIFFGSWCGDSKREVPRLLKILDVMSFPMDRVELIGVARADSVKKQSPEGQERGRAIYRVPTILVERQGREINRIVEYPVLSLERDLLQILSGQDYEPNYRAFPWLTRWLDEGLLADENVSARGLANQVRALVSSEGELSAAAYVLMARGQKHEAAKVFEMNVALFPESASRRIALARALHEIGEDEDAERMLRRALELDEDSRQQDDILELLEEVRVSLRNQAEAQARKVEE